MKKYLIIGNGTGAAGCIEGIRSVDKDGRITVISQENRAVYARPLISYLLEGKTSLEKISYRDETFYEKNNCDVIYGQTAEGLDPEFKKITLGNGDVYPYDELCVATGSYPVIPEVKGIENVKDIFTFWTLDDALALQASLTNEKKVLIVGAGLIGLKCAEGIAEAAGQITVCGRSGRILSHILDDECAKMMQKPLEEKGIKFILGSTPSEFMTSDGEGGYTAVLSSGEEVSFDILIMTAGVRPNTSLVKDAGGDVNKGILINDRMATSLDNVYAAGDCSEGKDAVTGESRVIAIMPNAYIQGFTAGVNMAGGKVAFDNAIGLNSIGFFGYNSMSAGAYLDGGEILEDKGVDDQGKAYLKQLFTKDGYLTGFMLVNKPDRAGIYTDIIRKKISLESLDFELMAKEPGLIAFKAEERKQMLGAAR